MSETAPVEALRAFAQTKPTEFDGFMVAWREKHPIVNVIEPIVKAELEQVDEPVVTSKKKSKVAASD